MLTKDFVLFENTNSLSLNMPTLIVDFCFRVSVSILPTTVF